jgi:hypothetical protein
MIMGWDDRHIFAHLEELEPSAYWREELAGFDYMPDIESGCREMRDLRLQRALVHV